MKIYQKFHLKQTYHEIEFNAYDIEKIEKITPEILRIYIPECSEYYANHVCEKENKPLVCCNCDKPHFQELCLDGWYVGNRYGFLDEDSYYAQLQTGIRVPVNKEIYEAWQKGWTKEPWTSEDRIYELGNDLV